MKHLCSKIINYIVLKTFNDNKQHKNYFAALICTFLASTLFYKSTRTMTDSEKCSNVHRQLSCRLTNDDAIDDARSRLDHSVRSRSFRSSSSLICWYIFSCSMLHTLYSTRLKSGEFGGERSGGTKSGVVYLDHAVVAAANRFVNGVLISQLV